MADLKCCRCGATAAPLEHPPLPGEVGALVQARVCPACWQEWSRTQVQVINEYRLSPADPHHYDILLAQMKAFLNLKES